MLWFLIGFPLVMAWGLYDAEIYAKDAAIIGIPWLLFVLGFIFIPNLTIPCIVGLALTTIWLFFRVFGTDFLGKNV